jgi:hypothetical protein
MALGRILAKSLRRDERLTKSTLHAPTASFSKNLNRLLSAAVVSPRFCRLLLSNPAAALAAGYNGECFQLTPAEYAVVTSVCATDIHDYAAQLLRQCLSVHSEGASSTPETQTDIRFVGVDAR